MVSTGRKQLAVLCGDEVKEFLIGSKSEESLSGLEFGSGNELDDCAFLDVVVVDDNINEDGGMLWWWMITLMKMVALFQTSYGRTRTVKRNKGKISRAL
jgi:hypothetical protein